jgi:hypothetical protein
MSTTTSICEQCGATIYKEHLDARIARYEEGKLLCPHCVEEYEAKHDMSGTDVIDLIEPIALGEEKAEDAELASSQTKITAFGSDGTAIGAASKKDETAFKRSLQPDKSYGTRCRIFHSKLNDGAIAFMTDQINDWIDKNPDVSIKALHTTIGIWEGKHADPNLIVTMIY